MRTTVNISCAVLLILTVAAPLSDARKTYRGSTGPPRFTSSPERSVLPPDLATLVADPLVNSTPTDTFELAHYRFDATNGAADAQGWIPRDLTAQLDEFWHIADGTELDGGQFGTLLPLDGAQSLWCGVDASSADPFCNYSMLPGYGSSWEQSFESVPFAVTGVATIKYHIRWDSEAGYDRTYVQYLDPFDDWISLPVDGGVGFYEGMGELTDSLVVDSATVEGTLKLRFYFESDGGWDDQDGLSPSDGAALVDNLTITDGAGPIDVQDFEGESPGDSATADGDWYATVPEPFGNFASLYPGTAVVQENICSVDRSHLWGWFDDPANSNYACGGFPDQGAWSMGNLDCRYLDEEIWSPPIPLSGAGDEFLLSFRVYRDMPLDNLQFYTWRVRSWVDGCPYRWRGWNPYYGGQKDWLTTRFGIGPYIEPGASHIQIAIGAWDGCPFWCIFQCSATPEGACRSHAPLVDEVRVLRVNTIGPQLSVRHIDLFQDTFAEDGTTTGIARADMAQDIRPQSSPAIQPGDSIAATIGGLGPDTHTGIGPAAYVYVSILPPGQPGKAGPDLEAPETRSGIGTRYPLVDSLVHDGRQWYCFRMDSAVTGAGDPVEDRFCFDLNDAVVEAGDTILYVLCADDGFGNEVYWSRRGYILFSPLEFGQLEDFTTSNQARALDNPMEFTILPAGGWRRGGDILYVDHSDDRGGPAEIYFDTAFWQYGINDVIDRYDVLGPSSVVNNSLASRVKDVLQQIVPCYRKILWCSGNLTTGLVGDGTGMPEKSDDYGLLLTFLDQGNTPGLYLSGDDIAEEWVTLSGAGAIGLRSTYMNFNLVSGSHVDVGEPVSPLLAAAGGSIFEHIGVPDQFYAFGGCPVINDFDVLDPTGAASTEMPYPNGSGDAVISQATPNSAATTARVILSGFGYDFIRNDVPEWMDRFEHLVDILRYFQNIIDDPTGIDTTARLTSYLDTAYPNPFNPITTIRYGVAERGHVSLRVYNVAGQLVRTLVNEVKGPQAGGFTATWDGRSDAGQAVSSGIYFYKLVANGFVKSRKMVLLK